MKKKVLAILITAALGSSVLAGCGSSNTESGATSPEASTAAVAEDAAPAVTVVNVGAGSTYSPYCYIDENDQHAGFDVELLKAVDDYLEEYEFNIAASPIDDLLTGLDAGNYDLISHSLGKTPEREEKYLFGSEDTGYKNFWILAKKDSDIQNFEDLVGKTVLDKPGKAVYVYIEEYNEAHPDAQIILDGIDELSAADRIKYIAEGRYDASADSKYVFETANAEIGSDVEIKGLAYATPTYFLFAKGQEELAARVDEALKALKEDGTVSRLSLEWLGEDVTIDESGTAAE